jgi:hypothetical protein
MYYNFSEFRSVVLIGSYYGKFIFQIKKNVIDTETKSHQYAINHLDFGAIGKNQPRKRLSQNFLIKTENTLYIGFGLTVCSGVEILGVKSL